ncbi:MAG: hypothetical protein AAGN66_06915, partial [Acidobacteriota bacterium]
ASASSLLAEADRQLRNLDPREAEQRIQNIANLVQAGKAELDELIAALGDNKYADTARGIVDAFRAGRIDLQAFDRQLEGLIQKLGPDKPFRRALQEIRQQARAGGALDPSALGDEFAAGQRRGLL